MGKRYHFDAETGEIIEEEITKKPDDTTEAEREQRERDERFGHHAGGQYL